MILSINKGGQINFMLFSLGSNKAFLVPDTRRATERNSISISIDITEDTIEYDLAIVLDFLILQDKHNIHTRSLNIKLICTGCKTD